MKVIFEERLSVVFSELVSQRWGDSELTIQTLPVSTRALYDKRTGALVLEHACFFEREWAPADRKLVELASTRELALRHVIAAADAWRAEVQAAVPAEPKEFFPAARRPQTRVFIIKPE